MNYSDNPEIQWRVEAMVPQIPETGAIPFLAVRDQSILYGKGFCPSCSESVPI